MCVLFSACLSFRANYVRCWKRPSRFYVLLKLFSLFIHLNFFLFSDWTLRPRKNRTWTSGCTCLSVQTDFFNRRQLVLRQLVRTIEISGQLVAAQNSGRRFQGWTRRYRCPCCRKDCKDCKLNCPLIHFHFCTFYTFVTLKHPTIHIF